MKKLLAVSTLATALFGLACNNAEALCQKQYDCREELEVQYEDDYVEICKAQHEGQDKAYRASAEQECEDLANAEIAYNTCLGTLDCEDLAAETADPGSDELCATPFENYDKAINDAAFGATCNGIDEDVAGEGEGEGEGEADAGG